MFAKTEWVGSYLYDHRNDFEFLGCIPREFSTELFGRYIHNKEYWSVEGTDAVVYNHDGEHRVFRLRRK